MVALLTISKGLTLAYNKDLQETQEPLYDAIETARLLLAVLPGLIDDAGVRRRAHARRGRTIPRWARPIWPSTWCATADPVPPGPRDRRARWCAHAEGRGRQPARLPGGRAGAASPPSWTPGALDALDPRRAVAARTLAGGPAPSQVRARAQALAAELKALGFEV